VTVSLWGTIDRFEVERQVGSGGMASVFRARDRHSGATVALKILHARSGEQTDRFEQEAQLLAELSHPAVVRYVAHGSTREGELYLAMEWLDGETLDERLARGPLGIAAGVDLIRRVADALASAHRRGIVHRDIKPSNLFLPGGDLEGVKVLDFGLARRVVDPRRLTQSGGIMGTPMYMAPEQARGEPYIDARADLFALGCVLFECLSGQPPFTGPTAMAVLAKICLDESLPIRELCPGLPSDLEQLLARLLAKERGRRPPDATGLASELERVADRLNVESAGIAVPRPVPASRSTRETLTAGEQRVACVVLVTRPNPGASASDHDRLLAEALARAAGTSATMVLPHAGGFDETDFDQLRGALEPYGARVERLLDGSMVVTLTGTGAPTDQAAAAARCALVVRGARPNVAITISTGRAVMLGRLPVGEVIDRGAELLRRESRGAVRLDDVTADLLGTRFEIVTEGAGRYLVGERQLGDAPRTVLGKSTSCVGRDRELALLEGTYDECVGEPVARAVLVTAPAGGGKSRLRHELLARLEERRTEVQLLAGWGDAMAAGSPFGLLGPALRAAAGLTGAEPEETRPDKLLAYVRRHLPPSRARHTAELLGELCGVAFSAEASPALRAARGDPRLMADQIRGAWLDWLDAACAQAPVLLVLDDVQWGDRPSLQLVEAALRALRERPFMVVALARPEIDERFPGLWRDSDVQRITLRGLTRRACQGLIRQVLGGVDDGTQEWLLERADGNPFYLEELIRGVASGARATLPETVLAMVQARLDALGSDPKRVLRAASVFGQSFTRAGVSALLSDRDRQILPTCLDVLVSREVIFGKEGGAAEGGYVFRHAVLRDAAYAMLTEGDRALGHLLAAEHLERGGERDAILLVEHFERGGDQARAARFCCTAAEQALEANDLPGAIARAIRGVELGASGPLLSRLARLEAQAQFWRGEYGLGETRATAAVQSSEPGSASWFEALSELVAFLGQQSKYAEVSRWATVIGAAAPADGAGDAQRACLIRAAGYLLPGGRYDTADAILARVAAETDGFTRLEPLLVAKVHAVRAARQLHSGDQAAAIALFESAIQAAVAAGDARTASETQGNLAATWADLGQLDRAEGLLRRELADAERLELGYLVVWALVNLAAVLTHSGRLDEARRAATQALEFGRTQGDQRASGAALLYLSSIAYFGGELRESEHRARGASEILPAPLQPSALAALSRAVLAQGRIPEALQYARKANELLASLGHVEEYESLVRLVLAESLAASGESAAARAALGAAYERLQARAALIANTDWRESFLSRLPDNARTMRLAREWGTVGGCEI
jgi:eukaryotic-like serine/threonine-protein kinase